MYVVKQLRGDGDSLLTKIDLPGKIENAVDKMDMKQLHHFVYLPECARILYLSFVYFYTPK